MQHISTIITKKPTFKQKRFAKAYIKSNGNATAAAVEAYNVNKDNAQVIGSQNLDKPAVIQEINRILSKTELTTDDQFIADRLLKSIESGIGVKATNKDALQGLNMLLKLKNSYPGTKSTSLKLNLKGNLSQESVDKVIKTLQNSQQKTNELIEDIG